MDRPLRIVVCVRPADPALEAGTGLGPLDVRAVDFAARLARAAAAGGEVRAVAVGDASALPTLQESIARGADVASHGLVDQTPDDGLLTARCLTALIAGLEPDLVLCGSRSDVGMHGTVPRELARLLSFPFVGNVVQLELQDASGALNARAVQRLERGNRWVWGSELPMVCGVEQEICSPRYLAVRRQRRATSVCPDTVDLTAHLPELREQVAAFGHYAVEGRKPRRVRPRKPKVTTAELSPAERMRMLRGGAKPVAAGGEDDTAPKRVGGDPDAAAAEIVKLLERKGLLDRP